MRVRIALGGLHGEVRIERSQRSTVVASDTIVDGVGQQQGVHRGEQQHRCLLSSGCRGQQRGHLRVVGDAGRELRVQRCAPGGGAGEVAEALGQFIEVSHGATLSLARWI